MTMLCGTDNILGIQRGILFFPYNIVMDLKIVLEVPLFLLKSSISLPTGTWPYLSHMATTLGGSSRGPISPANATPPPMLMPPI